MKQSQTVTCRSKIAQTPPAKQPAQSFRKHGRKAQRKNCLADSKSDKVSTEKNVCEGPFIGFVGNTTWWRFAVHRTSALSCSVPCLCSLCESRRVSSSLLATDEVVSRMAFPQRLKRRVKRKRIEVYSFWSRSNTFLRLEQFRFSQGSASMPRSNPHVKNAVADWVKHGSTYKKQGTTQKNVAAKHKISAQALSNALRRRALRRAKPRAAKRKSPCKSRVSNQSAADERSKGTVTYKTDQGFSTNGNVNIILHWAIKNQHARLPATKLSGEDVEPRSIGA